MPTLRVSRILGSASLTAVLALAASSARAGELSEVQLTVGAKGGASGNVLLAPDNGPVGFAAPFEEGAGGWGGGGGVFVEMRALKGYLGFEAGLLVDHARNKSTITYNSTVETEWGWSVTSLRIPLLLQVGTAMRDRRPRFGFGFGPDIVIPVKGDPVFDITQGEQYVPDRGVFTDGFKLRTGPQVGLAANPGVAIPVGPLRITVDLRYVVFFDVPKDYEDRVDLTWTNPSNLQTDVLAKWNMDLRILLGLGYDFSFGAKK